MSKENEKNVQKAVEAALDASGIAGKDITSLSEEELRELAGAGGDVDPEITPTVVIGTITSAIGSAVASYIASAQYKC